MMPKNKLTTQKTSALRIALHERSSRPPTASLAAPLSIAELEQGVRILDHGNVDPIEFWNDNLANFRQTLVAAIRDTSDALASPRLTGPLRIELKAQLPTLRSYLLLADRALDLLARRPMSHGQMQQSLSSIH